MTDWKPEENGDFLYVEELNSSNAMSKRLDNVKPDNTVEALKKAIATELRNPNGWNDVSVAFVGTDLTPNTATLSSFGVQKGDTLYFVRAVATQAPRTAEAPPAYAGPKTLNNVMFKDVGGKTLILHGIPLTWTVKQLREKLGEKENYETEYFRFIWAGKQLEDPRTLEAYGLHENCTVHMVMRLKGGRKLSLSTELAG